MTITAVIGWLGVALGICVSLPQVCHIYRTHRSQDVSVWTYRLLLIVCCCYLVRALAIHEAIFVVNNVLNVGMSAWVLLLKRKWG